VKTSEATQYWLTARKCGFDLLDSHMFLRFSPLDEHRFEQFIEFSIPENIRIPAQITANGKFTGTVNRFRVNLQVRTSNGNAAVAGLLDLDRKTYDLTAKTKSADLGYILKQDSLLGKITLDATAKGSGFDPKKMNSIFHVNLKAAEFKSYQYRGLALDADLHNGSATVSSSIHDPNISYELKGEGNFTGKYPSAKIRLQLDTLNPLALHLIKDSMQWHLQLDADFPSTDPDALQGKLNIYDIAFTNPETSLHLDSVRLIAAHTDTAQQIQFRSEMADLDWNGKYKLTQVSGAIKQLINHYYKLPGNPDTARIDAQEGFEVEFHVHGQAVVAGMATNADTDAAEFLAGYVDAGRFLTGLSADPEFGRQLNHALLQCGDDIADA